MRPGDRLSSFKWAPVIDVLGVIHLAWCRTHSAHWFRLCLDEGGPEVASRRYPPPKTSIVTCLWCLSVESTL